MSALSRRRLLAVAAGGLATTAAVRVAPVRAATDEDLAFANFAVSAELLLADLYARAPAAGTATRALRAGRTAALRHARALSALLAGAGETAPTAEDFAFEWPASVLATQSAVATTAAGVLRALLGAYQTAVATVSVPSHRVLYASLTASVGQQLGAVAALSGRPVAEPFPVAVDLETASATLEGYLG